MSESNIGADAAIWTFWCVWRGIPLRLGWTDVGVATQFNDQVWDSARDTLAKRSLSRSPGYETLLKARLEQMRARLVLGRDESTNATPFEIFTEQEILFYCVALAQLILLGAVADDDETCFIEFGRGGRCIEDCQRQS